MHISPHLCFDGQCREAMQLYQGILGGTLQTMLTYGETPTASSIESRWHDRIVHARLVLNEVELTGADMIPGSYQRPQGFFVTLTVSGVARAKEIFTALGQGGEIKLPFEKLFGRQALVFLLTASVFRGRSTPMSFSPRRYPYADQA